MRIWPRNLLGQTLLAVVLALLAAQLVSAFLLYRAAENRREAIAVNSTAMLLAYEAPRALAARSPAQERRRMRQQRRGRIPVEVQSAPPAFASDGTVDQRRTKMVREVLAENGFEPLALHVTIRKAGADPFLRDSSRPPPRWRREGWQERQLMVAAMQSGETSPWFVTRATVPRPERGVLGGIILQTGILFLVLVGVLYFLLRRITRPLARLSRRTEEFTRTQSANEPLTPSGPQDIAGLIEAHNAMETRIVSMLDEKDVMLGAIGHDLKTPLAALRVRIESVADETGRAKMAETIEDITRTLDDILSLARVGRAAEPAEATNLAALAASVVEEFEDMGEPVELGETVRLAAPIRSTWLKRALRNLISNALRYGNKARVAVQRAGNEAVILIDDEGPGIPEDRIAEMLEPFRRGEASRNRATGGSGLGLTLARAIAEQHGGRLVLANREEGGLRAEIRIPV